MLASVSASEGGFVGFLSFDITTQPILRAGKIRITTDAESGPISRFTILVFGKESRLSIRDLKLLGRFPSPIMVEIHGPGYGLLGGYYVSCKFRHRYYDSDNKLRDETATITVSEKNDLMVVDVRDSK